MIIRDKKHTFNLDVVCKMNEKEFTEHCLKLPIILQLPEKDRNAKIKEEYGNLTSNATESRKSGKDSSRRDLCNSDAKPIGRDSRAEQGANDGRKDIERKEDNTKIQKQKLSKQNSK